MVKTGSYRPCEVASPAECHRCFPETPPSHFFARDRLLREFLKDADVIIASSAFSKGRHVAWGVPAERIDVVENLMPPDYGPASANGGADRSTPNGRVRFGFFGVLNRFKGVTVLLDAIRHLPREIADRVDVVLFGAKLEEQPLDFQAQIKAAVASSRVTLFGAYAHESVRALMQSVDWVVVPSIWWENSPLVIQEARAARRPVLASNMGAMREKVRSGVDGWHFLAGDPLDLARKIESVVTGTAQLAPEPVDLEAQNRAALAAHLRLYGAPSG
jgi:glycosyltransferase involved in cell wall biosynthesis